MKGSNSRLTHRPDARYSNTAHVQGGMVTDADLTEAGQLHQARDEAQNLVTVNSGSPVNSGIVQITDDIPDLSEGYVIAEGKQGQLRSATGKTPSGTFELLVDQADLPLPPAINEKRSLLYADVWERPVFALQDPNLSDPGLHGAETSYRTRTMVQIKQVQLDALVAPAEELISKRAGPFAPSGNAQAVVKPKSIEVAVDECDPCADQVDVEQILPNALFRFEVISVNRAADGTPQSVECAWSMENAAAIELTSSLTDETAREMFTRDKGVYEFFSDATEAQIGYFEANHKAERPVLASELFPVAAPVAGGNGGQPFSHVRRWDGATTLDLGTNTTSNKLGTGVLSVTNGKAKLTLDEFTLEIAFKNAEILAGDYWLVELRRYAPEADQVKLVGADDAGNAGPSGIQHRFCPLFEIEADKAIDVSDAEKRRLSFPALSDIPASHVSYTPACAPLFHNAENVQDALDALCDLNATEVAYDPSPGCERFTGVKTVHEALERMCSVQDDTGLNRVLRLLMDWGVICGIRVMQLESSISAIKWTAGTMLDRAGILSDIAAGQFDLAALKEEQIHGDLDAIQKAEGEICISLAHDEKNGTTVHLSNSATAFGVGNRTFREAVDACIKGRRPIDFSGNLKLLNQNDQAVMTKVLNAWANRKTTGSDAVLSAAEAQTAARVNKSLFEEYATHSGSAENVDYVKGLMELAEREYNPNAVTGEAREKRRMLLEAAKLGTLATAEVDDELECYCQNILPPCPPDAGTAPHLVPVAAVTLVNSANRPKQIISLSTYRCRKQANTPRSHRYVQGDFMAGWINEVSPSCDRERQPPTKDFGDIIEEWEGGIFVPVDPPEPMPDPDDIWPPKKFPDLGFVDDYLPGGVRPGGLGPLINPGPSIRDLTDDDARGVLESGGYKVGEIIELGKEDSISKLTEIGADKYGVIGSVTPEPGDEVALITRDGLAVEYVVVNRGNGAPVYTAPSLDGKALDKKIDDAIKGIDFTKAIAGADLGALADTGELEGNIRDLATEKDKVRAEVEILRSEKDTLLSDVENMRTVLDGLETSRKAISTEIEKTIKVQDEFKAEMRLDQPIEAVLEGNTNAINKLKARGLVSVRDLQDQPTGTLTTLLRNTGLTGSTLKSTISNFRNR